MKHSASNIRPSLVKPLHPLAEIAARLSQTDAQGVRLFHAVGGAPHSIAANPTSSLDPATAVQRALAEPLDYPPLAAGIVPGDRVAIAVDSTVPCLAAVIRGTVAALMHAGVEPQDISIVTTDEPSAAICRDAVVGCDPEVRLVTHKPEEENDLCLVGTTKRGQPLLVNRTIFDADLILPVGCARLGRDNAYDSIFPRFSNAETIAKYRTPAEYDALMPRHGKRSPADEAGWMIGVPMTIQVVPGPNETVAHVLAGEPQAVARRCEVLCQQMWSWASPQRVSLLVATVSGGVAAQTWDNIARALEIAEHVLREGGVVALCTNLDEPPGRSLGRLVGDPDLDVAARKISHDHDADTWPAWRLARALQRGPVFLLSQLDAETVEDMGLAPVANIDELVRLVSHYDSFLLVPDSQHAAVVVEGDDNEH